MSPTEIRIQPNYQWRMGLLGLLGMAGFYFYFGYLPFVMLVAGGALALVLLFNPIRGVNTTDPCVVLDEKGVFDRRLKVGVIRWDDIRKIKSYSLYGAEYISLDLHDLKTYEARRPLWLRGLSQVERLHGMSPIAISTNALDMDRVTLASMIHEGCGMTRPNVHDDVKSYS